MLKFIVKKFRNYWSFYNFQNSWKLFFYFSLSAHLYVSPCFNLRNDINSHGIDKWYWVLLCNVQIFEVKRVSCIIYEQEHAEEFCKLTVYGTAKNHLRYILIKLNFFKHTKIAMNNWEIPTRFLLQNIANVGFCIHYKDSQTNLATKQNYSNLTIDSWLHDFFYEKK